jgi:hypothetical protein
MPLRDHFRPPVWKMASWEGFHATWPVKIVERLNHHLPDDYSAEPRVQLGTNFEIDVCAYEEEPLPSRVLRNDERGGVATAAWAPPRPTFSAEADPSEQYAYEVLVYDHSRGRVLVAAVEICSPANKDRPESRRAFVGKCATRIGQGVCVSIVDTVTTRQFNLYADLIDFLGLTDPAFAIDPPATYAITCRGLKVNNTPRFESWAYPLIVGELLPTLPLWLADDLAVSLELEASYEETCHALRIS